GLSNLRTMTLTQKYIRGRLADSLIFLIETYDFAEDGTIDVTLSREDLAQLSSMTTSNAIRTLSAFAGEGVVELVGKRIKVLDLERLKKISVLG
ncbi:MAG: helix-turn-helix domain-containing protein, partial [Rikenellaceae bacterium]|nr:helix-turn-helix domain-containing protein [Rikenellaceae bacterium]